MKRNIFVEILFIAVIGFLVLASCDDAVKDEILAIPSNVEITVEGRWVTVSWNAVPNASGYEVYTESVGCPSGSRISNTANNTFTNHAGEALTSVYPANGSVQFPSATSIKIWLMAADMSADTEAAPMATSVSAKVKAISTKGNYLDSEYSVVVTKNTGSTDSGDHDDDDDHHH